MTEEDTGTDDKEIDAAQKVISALLIALKNSALYPELHESYLKSVENILLLFAEFSKISEYLRVYIEKDQFIFKGQVICAEGAKKENLCSILFRDGIRWIEFRGGIEADEIAGFLKILKQYRVLSENSDGDVATALWEANFFHIAYEAEDAFWNAEHLDAALQTGDIESKEIEIKSESPISECLPLSEELWQLSSKEMLELQQMVFKEENEDKTKDALDVLLIILNEQHSEEEFLITLDFIKDEFQQTLIRGEFELAHHLLGRLHEFKRFCQAEHPSRVSLFQNFFTALSGADILESLYKVRPALENASADMLKSFRNMFNFLHPEAIMSLGPMLAVIKNPQLRRIVMEIIGAMAGKDIRPLEKLLESPDEEMIHRLVFILGKLKGKKIKELLLKMLGHSSETVRREALNSLISEDNESIEVLFPLLNDESQIIRTLVSEMMYRKKHPAIEEAMIDYLQHRRFKHKDRQHIVACYKVLGKNGSSASLVLLEKVLFEKTWASLFGIDSDYEREAAALALAEMGTIEANTLLAKASKHPFPGVRRAYRKVTEASYDR